MPAGGVPPLRAQAPEAEPPPWPETVPGGFGNAGRRRQGAGVWPKLYVI